METTTEKINWHEIQKKQKHIYTLDYAYVSLLLVCTQGAILEEAVTVVIRRLFWINQNVILSHYIKSFEYFIQLSVEHNLLIFTVKSPQLF